MSYLRTSTLATMLLRRRQMILASGAGHVASPPGPISSRGRPSSSLACCCIQASAFPLLGAPHSRSLPSTTFIILSSSSTRPTQSRAHLSTTPATRSQTKHTSPPKAKAKAKMTEREEGSAKKKPRTEEKYKLFYWPGLPGRGEPVRLALEEAGVDYEDVVYTQGVKAVTSLIGTAQHFAPPILQHGDVEISQLPNIMFYLGQKLKLAPEDDQGKYRVNQLFLTIADVQNECHDTHHPIASALYYEDQKDSALLKAKDFRETRIPKFFKHFELALEANEASKGEWLVGDSLTYADLMLHYLVDGLLFAFPNTLKKLKPEYPKIFALYERVKARPKIAAYLESDRRQKFSNGIYRHYAELDAPEEKE